MIIYPKTDTTLITVFLKRFFPTVKIEHHIGVNLTYLVPQIYIRNLPVVLGKLDQHQDRLKIKSFGIAGRTLEEVFLNVETKKYEPTFKKTSESLLGKIRILKGKQLRRSRLHALAFNRICDYKPNNFPLAVMVWALTLFSILTNLEKSENKSEAWKQISANASFKDHIIHAYLEASTDGDKISIYKNFSNEFTKTISTNLKDLCEDCRLTLQSKENFFNKMPYDLDKEISTEFLNGKPEGHHSFVSFSYDSPVIPSEHTKEVDVRVLEKITNKEDKRLTVHFSMQSPHLSYRALNLAHNFILM